MKDQLLKAGIISEQRAAAMERLSNKKREDDKKKSEAESEIHKYKFIDEKFKKKIRIVNKNKDGVILSNGVAEIQISWKDVKESFHVVDKFYLIPNVKQQMELLDVEKKMEWFQKRFVSVMGIYSAHRTGSKPSLMDMYGVGDLCQRYQEEHNSTPLEFVQALRDYFKYLDQRLHYSSLRWK
jgi:hypothetical protein